MRYLVAFLLLSATALAAPPGHHWSQMPQHVEDYEAYYDAADIYWVQPGETRAYPAGPVELIFVEGELMMPRNADIDTIPETIIVTPQGHANFGTPADPVLGKVNTAFRDGPIVLDDTVIRGRGIQVYGRIDVHGRVMQRRIELDSFDGTLPFMPQGWEDGDEIMVADLRGGKTYEIGRGFLSGDQVVGNIIPQERRDEIGVVVCNLSSNITFSAENPAGVRPHFICTEFAEPVLEYHSIFGAGRTRPEAISADNRIGEYGGWHFHHLAGKQKGAGEGGYQFILRGVAFDGLDYSSKWGPVVHGSHYGLVEDVVSTRFASGVTTEDGNEVGTMFRRLTSIDHRRGPLGPRMDAEGFSGAGFWMKSVANHYEDCLSLNTRIGIQTAMTLVGATGIAGSTEQTAPRYPGEWPQTGIISGQQTTLSMGQNRFAFASLAAADFWGGNDVVFPGGGVDGRPMFRSGGLPVYWTDSFFGYSGGGWRPVVQFNFRTSSGLFDNCTVRADEDAQYQSSFGIGPNQLGYAQFIYSAGTHFIGTRYGIGTGHDSIFSGNRFDTDIGIKVDALSSSNWGFGGLTVGENEYTGQEHVITGPSYYEPLPETIDDIVPADLTLEELFQNIDEWRSQWGATSDPNEQRKQELLQLIAELEAQLAAAREELENL